MQTVNKGINIVTFHTYKIEFLSSEKRLEIENEEEEKQKLSS